MSSQRELETDSEVGNHSQHEEEYENDSDEAVNYFYSSAERREIEENECGMSVTDEGDAETTSISTNVMDEDESDIQRMNEIMDEIDRENARRLIIRNDGCRDDSESVRSNKGSAELATRVYSLSRRHSDGRMQARVAVKARSV